MTTTSIISIATAAGSEIESKVATSATAGVPLVSNGAAVAPSFTTAVVAGGGTGQATLTNHGVLVGAGTSAITQLAAGTANTVLRSGGPAADPAYSTNFKVSAADVMTNTSQPSFLAYANANIPGVTGDGTAYTVAFNTTAYDQTASFGGTVFTAPVTGKYLFTWSIGLSGVAADNTDATCGLGTSTQLTLSNEVSIFPVATSTGAIYFSGSSVAAMTAGDIAFVQVVVSGHATKNIGIFGAALTAANSSFGGFLIG